MLKGLRSATEPSSTEASQAPPQHSPEVKAAPPAKKRLIQPQALVYRTSAEETENFILQLATLSVDGWSARAKDPVIGVAVNVDSRTYLLETVDTTGQSHTL